MALAGAGAEESELAVSAEKVAFVRDGGMNECG